MASKTNPSKSILPSDAVMAEVTVAGRVVTAICRLGKTQGRALKLTPLYVRAEDYEELARGGQTAAPSASPSVPLQRTVPPAAPVEAQPTDICGVCNLHRSAVQELGCVRKQEDGSNAVGCVLG